MRLPFYFFIQFSSYPADHILKGLPDLDLRILYRFVNELLSLIGCYQIAGNSHHVIDR